MRAGAGRITGFARRFTAPRACARNPERADTMSSNTHTPAMNPESTRPLEMDRRQFLTTTAVVGGGMMLGFWMPPKHAEAAVIPTDLATRAEPWYRDPMVP